MPPSTLSSNSSGTQSLSVELPSGYVEWIEAQAERNDVPVHRIIQQLVDNQRKREAERAARGNKAPSDESDSVADNLRSASKRLRSLVDRAQSLDDEPGDVLERVESRLNEQLEQSQNGTDAADDDTQSMFDLMDD